MCWYGLRGWCRILLVGRATFRVATMWSPLWFLSPRCGFLDGIHPGFQVPALVARPWARLTAWAPPASIALLARVPARFAKGTGMLKVVQPSSIDRILPIWSCSLSSWRTRLDVFRIRERSSRPWAGIPCRAPTRVRPYGVAAAWLVLRRLLRATRLDLVAAFVSNGPGRSVICRFSSDAGRGHFVALIPGFGWVGILGVRTRRRGDVC